LNTGHRQVSGQGSRERGGQNLCDLFSLSVKQGVGGGKGEKSAFPGGDGAAQHHDDEGEVLNQDQGIGKQADAERSGEYIRERKNHHHQEEER